MIAKGQDIKAVFQQATRGGAAIRVAIDGADLTVPEPFDPAGTPSDEFYPDFEPDYSSD
jgi:hypothetical protein